MSVDSTSTFDVSSGDNTFDATVVGTSFIAAATGSTISWATGNTLNITTNEDSAFDIDVRLDGNAVSSISTSAATNGSVITNVDGTLKYTSTADFYGTGTFDFVLATSGLTGTVLVTVRPVNDEPIFTNGLNITIDEDDAGVQTVAGHITGIDLGPANETDSVAHGPFGTPHNDQTASFRVSNDNNSLFSTQPAIDSSGELTFALDNAVTNALAAGETAVAIVTLSLSDGGGIDNGGDDTSAAATFTITVTASNDGPIAVVDTDSTDEDTSVTTNVITNDTDPDDSDVLSLQAASATLVSATDDQTSGPITITDATVSQAGDDITFDPGTDFNYLADGETATVEISYVVEDGNSGTDTGTLTVTVRTVREISA